MLTFFYRVLLGLFLCFFGFNALQAQGLGGKTKASDYSDQEILQMIEKAESAGLSEGQVVELARARGMSASEIEAFRARVQKVKLGSIGGPGGSVGGSGSLGSGAASGLGLGNAAAALGGLPPKGKEDNTIGNADVPSAAELSRKSGDAVPLIPENIGKKPDLESSDFVATSWDIAKIFDEKRFPAYTNGRALKAPDQYLIGVGDEISVTVFGNSYFNKVSRVDERGRIDLGTALGKVYVKGLAFAKLEKVLYAAINQKINLGGNELEIDLSFSRQVSINVTGEVQRPGTYQIPAANTVFNLMVLSGGPTVNGSIRDIEVVRGGRVAYRFDVYEYLVNPQNNLFLEDGDFVVVKPVKKRIVLKGGVLRAGRVELLDKEGLVDALKYAGGFSTRADASRVTLSRLNGKTRSLYTLDYTNTKPAALPAVEDGDEVFVFEQGEEMENRVKVEGEVYFPGTYALSEGLGLKQLLAQAGGFTPEANQNLAFVIRTLTDGAVEYLRLPLSGAEMENFKLQNKDQLVVFSQSRFRDAFEVEVRGEVRNPVRLAYRKGLTLGVLLDYAGGLKYSADITEVEILRSSVFTDDYKNGDRNQTVRIKIDLASQGNFKELALFEEDIVLVRKVSNLDDRIGVSISGEVLHPGVFVLGKNENRVRDLIAFSGGLTEFAYADAAQLFRANGEQLVFDLDAVMRSKNSEYNYRLMDGDRLEVPLVQDLVILPNTDTLLNKRNILAPYIAGKRAGFYMRNYSLGFDKEHRKRLLYLQEPGGKIRRSKHFGLFVLTPKVKAGSKIYFQPSPEKKEKAAEAPKKETDWNKIIENVTIKLTGIATLWVLLSRI